LLTLSGPDKAKLLEQLEARHAAVSDLVAEASKVNGRELVLLLDRLSTSTSDRTDEYTRYKQIQAEMMRDRLSQLGEISFRQELAGRQLNREKVRRKEME
jgi:hypothetical protein